MTSAAPRRASLAELAALRDTGARVELVAGEILHKANPTPEHGLAQAKTGELLGPFNRRGGGERGPGGWWILAEVEIQYGSAEVYRHDLVGFRREAYRERPRGIPVTERPDWVAEILSESTARYDVVVKLRTLHRATVPHYWILDPEKQTFTVYRWTADGYLAALVAAAGERVRAEPFDAVEISVSELFGNDE